MPIQSLTVLVRDAETLRAMDSGAPLCADAAGASLLEAAPPAQLAASFGCGASGDARCVVLEARRLGRCVLGPPVIQHVATGGRFVIERACWEVCCLTWAARIGGSNLLSASQYLLPPLQTGLRLIGPPGRDATVYRTQRPPVAPRRT